VRRPLNSQVLIMIILLIQSLPDKLRQQWRRFLVGVAQTSRGVLQRRGAPHQFVYYKCIKINDSADNQLRRTHGFL